MSENQFEVNLKVEDEQGKIHSLNCSLEQLKELGIGVYLGSFWGGCFDLTSEESKNLIFYSTKKRGKKITTKDELEGAVEAINEGIMRNFFEED
jgi:hypothetical protein